MKRMLLKKKIKQVITEINFTEINFPNFVTGHETSKKADIDSYLVSGPHIGSLDIPVLL